LSNNSTGALSNPASNSANPNPPESSTHDIEQGRQPHATNNIGTANPLFTDNTGSNNNSNISDSTADAPTDNYNNNNDDNNNNNTHVKK